MKKLLLLFLFFSATVALTQQRRVIGTVTAKSTGVPLAGATVRSEKTATIVDSLGRFSILSEAGGTLTFIYIGMDTLIVKVPLSGNVNVALTQSNNRLNDVVVTGYQTQRRAELTGSVAVVDVNDIQDLPNNNPMQALQGRVPGLYVTTNGDPSAASSVVIRGYNSLGFNSPLYVIDGVSTIDPAIFQSLDPNIIQNIQILKDASSESIYGSRASNGVIIVTTKQGAKGKVKIQFNNSETVENYASRIKVLDAQGMGRAIWQAAINDGTDPSSATTLFSYTQHAGTGGYPMLDQITPIRFLGGDSTEPSANTDWQNAVFHSGIITSNDLTITAGSDNSHLLIDLSYLDNSGLIKYNNGYRRYGARINASTNLFNGKARFGNNIQFFQSSETPVGIDLGGASVLYDGIFLSPLIPIYTTKGDFAGPLGSGFSDRDNPLLTSYINRWNKNNEFNLFGNLFLEVDVLKNLVFKSNLGYSYDNIYQRQILQKYTAGFISRTINSLTINQNNELDLTWSNTLNYHLDASGSKLDILLGTEAIKRDYNWQTDYKQGFAIQNDDYFYLSAGTGTSTANGSATGSRLLSYFGKINYSLFDKYLASATVREDGSSRFGVNNRYAFFPAASIGWRINKESFLKNVTWLSDLKLRSGWGVTGNQEIGDVASLGLYQTNYGTTGETGQSKNFDAGANNGTAYDISGVGQGNLPSGYVAVQAANPNLKWESTSEFNEGIDFGLFNNKLTGSFDYFTRKTKNILVQPPYPGILGEGQIQWVNGATKSNKGWELVLSYQNHIGELSYSVTGNLFSFHDKITYLPASVISAYAGNVQQTILGHAPSEMFGYVVEGIFQNQQQIASHASQPGAGVGRLMYKDLNGNGEIDALDQTWIGNQLPNLNYGLTVNLEYKGFSFSFFLQGIQGAKVNNGNKAATDFVGLNPGVNFGARTLSAWTPQNSGSSIPALSLVDNNDEARFSNYYVESGSYMKLRTAELGYTIPQKSLQFIKGISRVKFYLMGENLLTFKKTHGSDAFSGPDPEIPGSFTTYPVPRKFTIGVNLSF